MVVKSLAGTTWFYGGFNRPSGRFEVRRLAITAQDGLELRGTYSNAGSSDRGFTGRLGSERHARLAVDDGSEQLEGVLPGDLSVSNAQWPLLVTGGTADRQSLPFGPVSSDAAGPNPRASLDVRFGQPLFRDDPLDPNTEISALMGLTPITFDASGSTGDSLSYFVVDR